MRSDGARLAQSWCPQGKALSTGCHNNKAKVYIQLIINMLRWRSRCIIRYFPLWMAPLTAAPFGSVAERLKHVPPLVGATCPIIPESFDYFFYLVVVSASCMGFYTLTR